MQRSLTDYPSVLYDKHGKRLEHSVETSASYFPSSSWYHISFFSFMQEPTKKPLRKKEKRNFHLALFPGHSFYLAAVEKTAQLRDKIWEWPGIEANFGPDDDCMEHSVETSASYFPSSSWTCWPFSCHDHHLYLM